jgi:hypothetical protein
MPCAIQFEGDPHNLHVNPLLFGQQREQFKKVNGQCFSYYA